MNEIDSLLSKGGLSLERLATLCRVAQEGGLSKAAAGDISRLSLFSRQIKDLESFFGVALTRRMGRTVVLTDAARKLAAQVRRHFKEMAAFREAAGEISPTLSIGASQSVLEWWLWPRMAEWQKRLPIGTRIRALVMRSVDLSRAVEEHELDMALVRTDAVPRSLRSKPLFSIRYELFVPLAMLAKAGHEADLLHRLPLAIAMGGQFQAHFQSAAAKAGVEPNIQLECPSFILAARAVASGEYAAILPDLAEVAFRGLPVARQALPLAGIPPRRIAMAWHPRAPEYRLKLLAPR